MKIAVIGGGWAGMAAAVRLAQQGHAPEVFEASRTLGGRARALMLGASDTPQVEADNGQHILIGAYSESLQLMRAVGQAPEQLLLRKPLAMRFADGSGLSFPRWPAPLDALAGIASAKGWTLAERAALLHRAVRWRLQGFRCAETATVADVCASLPARLMDEFIEPLCVSALNLPAAQASGSVFLRILKDALFAGSGGSHFLVPRCSLSDLFPAPAAMWLQKQGLAVHTGCRVQELIPSGAQWQLRVQQPELATQLEQTRFDAVVLACPPQEAARLALGASEDERLPARAGVQYQRWAAEAQALQHTAIATVYARTSHRLPANLPWLALRPHANAPAQFVFDRGHLHQGDAGQQGLMAFVISDCQVERQMLQQQVLQQASKELGWSDITPVQTVIEKRATFACTPALQRPAPELGHGLWACGDYVAGPYPATLEGAVRSASAAVEGLLKQLQD